MANLIKINKSVGDRGSNDLLDVGIIGAAFRRNAGLGGRLRGIIDFDGLYSTYRHHSQALPSTAIQMWQSVGSQQTLPQFVLKNTYPLPAPRWQEVGGPYTGRILQGGQIHAAIPQYMMHFAASLTRG